MRVKWTRNGRLICTVLAILTTAGAPALAATSAGAATHAGVSSHVPIHGPKARPHRAIRFPVTTLPDGMRAESHLPGGSRRASIGSVCGNNGTGYCLNDWNNAGGAVKMYYGGTTNDNYIVEQETLACNNGVSTATCPINVNGLNTAGAAIIEILNPRDGRCVATNGNAQAVEGTCADLRGIGGSNGVTGLWFSNSSCHANWPGFFLNRYWTQNDSTWVWLQSGGALGAQAYFVRTQPGTSSCWANVNT
jgi:hypothetical protein